MKRARSDFGIVIPCYVGYFRFPREKVANTAFQNR